jgi:hypothetical protein
LAHQREVAGVVHERQGHEFLEGLTVTTHGAVFTLENVGLPEGAEIQLWYPANNDQSIPITKVTVSRQLFDDRR